jgi:hypothetical protein
MPVATADAARTMISTGIVGMSALFLVANPNFITLIMLELRKSLWI